MARRRRPAKRNPTSGQWATAAGGSALAIFGLYRAVVDRDSAMQAKQDADKARSMAPNADSQSNALLLASAQHYDEAASSYNWAALAFGGLALVGGSIAVVSLWPKR